jgi:hypothetical protein
MKIIAVFLLFLVFVSCGPSPKDFKVEEIKSNCDCLRVRAEIIKNKSLILVNVKDKSKRNELRESSEYEGWMKKDMEINNFCTKNFRGYFSDDKCNEFKVFFEEFNKSNELYRNDNDDKKDSSR